MKIGDLVVWDCDWENPDWTGEGSKVGVIIGLCDETIPQSLNVAWVGEPNLSPCYGDQIKVVSSVA